MLGAKSLGRFLLWVLLGWVVLTVASIAMLRVLPPPTTAFMLVDRWERLMADRPRPEQRQHWVPWRQIHASLPLAIVAAEDQKFPQHHGFDFSALMAAFEHNEKGRSIRGGSTISQQLAKNLFLWSGRSYVRKGLEAWFTLWLEVLLSKQRILEVYMNVVEFGDGIYGVDAAASAFFHKTPAHLSSRESALLAAVLPNPIRYRADRPGGWVLERRYWIERQMRQLGPQYVAQLPE